MRKSLLKTISMILIFVILLASPILSAELGAIEKSKLLDEGEKVIRDFYNPKSANYYGKKVDSFFADDKNMQKVKKDAEEYAKANATDTIYIEQIYLYEELKKYVYSDLYFKLKKIHDSYDYKDKNKGSNNSHVGKFDIILSTTGTFVGILGVSALLGCPWGWGVTGAFAFSTIEGWVHYKWKKDSNKKEMIEKYKKDIEENKDQLMNAWRKSFSRGR